MTPEDLTEELTRVCGSNLLSVVLYGSAAAGDHTGKRSDYNVLVVLEEIGLPELRALAKSARKWIRRGNPPPLLFTRDRLGKSVDVFPIEIADIKNSHRVLFGENPIAALEVHAENLRWQLESELKTVLIGLRERYLLTKGKPGEVTELLIESLTPLLVLCRATLRLHTSEVPLQKMDAMRALARHVPFDTTPLETIERLKEGRKVEGVVPDQLFADTLRATETIVDSVDRLVNEET